MAELLDRMSAAELTEWQAYFRVEPFGEQRADWRAGHAAAAVINTNLKKGAKPLSPGDFVLDTTPPTRRAAARLKAALKARG